MSKIMKALVGGTLAGSLARLAGGNPLLRLGAASLATRIAASSLPLGLVMIGAASAWNRHRKSKAKPAGTARRAARISAGSNAKPARSKAARNPRKSAPRPAIA